MSLSFDIPVITGISGADVTVPQLDQTKWQRTGVGTRQNGVKYASYTYNTSDPAHPVTVTVEASTSAKARTINWSLTLRAYATATESITGAITYRPVEAAIAVILPADMTVEVADFRKMIDALYGSSFKVLTVKVPDTVVISDMLFAAAEVW